MVISMALEIIKEPRDALRHVAAQYDSDGHVIPMVVLCGVTSGGVIKPLLCDADGKLILPSS